MIQCGLKRSTKVQKMYALYKFKILRLNLEDELLKENTK